MSGLRNLANRDRYVRQVRLRAAGLPQTTVITEYDLVARLGRMSDDEGTYSASTGSAGADSIAGALDNVILTIGVGAVVGGLLAGGLVGAAVVGVGAVLVLTAGSSAEASEGDGDGEVTEESPTEGTPEENGPDTPGGDLLG